MWGIAVAPNTMHLMNWVNYKLLNIIDILGHTGVKTKYRWFALERLDPQGTEINTCSTQKNDVKGMMRGQSTGKKSYNNQGN